MAYLIAGPKNFYQAIKITLEKRGNDKTWRKLKSSDAQSTNDVIYILPKLEKQVLVG